MSTPDKWRTFLTGAMPDLNTDDYDRSTWWDEWLTRQGFTGSISDKETAYWISKLQ